MEIQDANLTHCHQLQICTLVFCYDVFLPMDIYDCYKNYLLLQYSYINIAVILVSISSSLFIHGMRIYGSRAGYFFCVEERNYLIEWNVCGKNYIAYLRFILFVFWNNSN